MAKLHPKLSASGIEHTVTIDEPPVDSSRDDQPRAVLPGNASTGSPVLS
jgi:hypothetical protein